MDRYSQIRIVHGLLLTWSKLLPLYNGSMFVTGILMVSNFNSLIKVDTTTTITLSGIVVTLFICFNVASKWVNKKLEYVKIVKAKMFKLRNNEKIDRWTGDLKQ